jgi:UDP-N-acetylglucosamine 2-epimerase (non-hydrolysing)
MIDTLVKMLPRAEQSSALARFNLERRRFVLVTLHRPANVDDPNVLREIVAALYDIGARCPVVFPVHPRTRARAGQLDLIASDARVQWIEPLGYLDFLALMRQSAAVITDSGGVQEETTFLGVPCLTVRPNTERPITIEMGTNQLVRAERDAIGRACDDALMQTRRAARVPEKWDGYAAERIVDVMRSVP